MTGDGRRTIDEKFEVQTSLVAEAAAVETVLESVEVSGLGAGLTASGVSVEPVMGAP